MSGLLVAKRLVRTTSSSGRPPLDQLLGEAYSLTKDTIESGLASKFYSLDQLDVCVKLQPSTLDSSLWEVWVTATSLETKPLQRPWLTVSIKLPSLRVNYWPPKTLLQWWRHPSSLFYWGNKNTTKE